MSVERWTLGVERSIFTVRRFITPNSYFLTPPSGGRVRRSAFTLIEMLIVISIISVLLGLLYGSLERARTFSRRAIAYTEVKNIEAALKQYYAHYHDWPPTDLTTAKPTATSPDDGFVIDGTVATVLEGKVPSTSTDTTLTGANPDRIPFIEFARKNNNGEPINPFRLTSSTETRQYKVLFDRDNNSKIHINETIGTFQFQTNVYASVAVWTVIPGSSSSDQAGAATATYEVLGSWNTFSK